jgi:MFS family permease
VARPVTQPVRRPWWIPPFLGRIPPVGEAQLRLLGMVSLALFFESYDLSMGTSALKHIAEDLGIGEDRLGGTLSAIRLGAIPAFLLAPFADRIGRRRVFLACVVASSLTTFATAFVRTTEEFVVMQMVTRTALVLGAVVAIVIVAEEFPAGHRGWALGMLGALSACGHGLGAALFAQIESLPYGWRALYALGVVPLVFWPRFRAGVVETTRFRDHAATWISRGPLRDWLGPIVALARRHPGRALAMAAVAGLLGIGEVSAFQFTGYYAQRAHGWSPGDYSIMVLTGGGVGIVGNIVAGRLGDRIGRRRVGALFLCLMPAAAILFYNGPGWTLPIGFAGFVFCATAAGVIVRAFSTELFPTSHRGTSTGWAQLLQTLGWAAGLWLVGVGSDSLQDLAIRTSQLACVTVVAAALLLLLPETHQRELESLSLEGGL